MADSDVWLRPVPSDANPNDVRLYPKPDAASGPAAIIGARFALAAVKQREHPEEEDAVRTNHSLRLLFGRTPAAVATVGAPWYLWPRPKPQDDAEEYAQRSTHSLLHRYRQAFQTVGQSYRQWPPAAKADQTIEPDAQRADHSLLHRYRVGYQTVGQPAVMRARPQQRLDDLEYDIQRQASLHAYRQFDLATAAPGQPWWMWPRAVADQWVEPNPLATNHAAAFHPFRRAPTPTSGNGHRLLMGVGQ